MQVGFIGAGTNGTKIEPVPKTRFLREKHAARRGIARIYILKRDFLVLLSVLGVKPVIWRQAERHLWH